MRTSIAFAVLLTWASGAQAASNWEKFFKPIPSPYPLIKSATPPEPVALQGDGTQQLLEFWRNGFAPLGFSSFNSPNSNTRDAIKLGAKLGAKFVVLATELRSSTTTAVPLTMPTTQTSVSNGSVTAYGSGGSASGTYSGTTTTYGSQTTYIPITVERFDKGAWFIAEMPKTGSGLLVRPVEGEEITRFETQRAFVVRAVRQGSPGYTADVLPGDVVLKVNDEPADYEAIWARVVRSGRPIKLSISRNGASKEITLVIPPEWTPTD